MDEDAAKSIAWQWITEKLLDNKSINPSLLKYAISKIPDLSNCSRPEFQEKVALCYLEEMLSRGRLEAGAVTLVKCLMNFPKPCSNEDADLVWRVSVEVVLGHIRKTDANGVRDLDSFVEDVDRMFPEDCALAPCVERRHELWKAFHEEKWSSIMQKYPFEALKRDLLKFIEAKKAHLNKAFLDQLVHDVYEARCYVPSCKLQHWHKISLDGTSRSGNKRAISESTLSPKHTHSEGAKKIKHNKNALQVNLMVPEVNMHDATSDAVVKNGSLYVPAHKSHQVLAHKSLEELEPDNGNHETIQLSGSMESMLKDFDNEKEMNKCKTSAKLDVANSDDNFVKSNELPELSVLMKGKTLQRDICLKCSSGGSLSGCNVCNFSMHIKCLESVGSGCPVCAYEIALKEYKQAEIRAMESKMKLLLFLNPDKKQVIPNMVQQDNGKNPHPAEISDLVDTVDCGFGGPSNLTEKCNQAQNKKSQYNVSEIANTECSKLNQKKMRGVVKMQCPGEVHLKNGHRSKRQEAHALGKEQDSNEGNVNVDNLQRLEKACTSVPKKESVSEEENLTKADDFPTQKSPAKSEEGPPLPRRSQRTQHRNPKQWTKEEEDFLKKCVDQFPPCNGKTAWTRILQHGKHIFHQRNANDLRFKWRNMQKSIS